MCFVFVQHFYDNLPAEEIAKEFIHVAKMSIIGLPPYQLVVAAKYITMEFFHVSNVLCIGKPHMLTTKEITMKVVCIPLN